MICKNCGGELQEGSKYCGFCQTEVEESLSEEEKRNKHIEECLGMSSEEAGPTWWEDGCGGEEGGCGHGLTGKDKDFKYTFTIFGIAVGVIVFALAVKAIAGALM